MDRDSFKSRGDRFKIWWALPPTRSDRFISALLGLWAFLLISIALAFIFAPNHSISISALLIVVCSSSFGGAILGAAFPKLMRCVALPFAFIGFSVGSS